MCVCACVGVRACVCVCVWVGVCACYMYFPFLSVSSGVHCEQNSGWRSLSPTKGTASQDEYNPGQSKGISGQIESIPF